MVTELNSALDPGVRPGAPLARIRSAGRHIGIMPVVLVLVLLVLLVGGIIWGAVSRIQRDDTATRNVDELPVAASASSIEPAENFTDIELPPADLVPSSPSEDVVDLFLPTTPTEADREIEEVERQARVDEATSRLQGNLSVSRIPYSTADVSAQSPAAAGAPGAASLPEPNFDLPTDPVAGQNELLRQAAAVAGASDPNAQGAKEGFLRDGERPAGYLAHAPIAPYSPYELKTGTVIPGILLTALNSDLPGTVIGQVSVPVYDSVSGQHELIPRGTKIIGAYQSRITYGQRRVLVVWRRLVYPNGTTLDLESMQGSDQGGSAGFNDLVKNHFGRLFGSMFLLSLFQSVPGAIDGDEDAEPDSRLEEIAATNVSETGQQLVDRNLKIQPTLRVRTGYRFNVLVNRDIIFPGPSS